ncbi:hypothetical protein QJQ45_020082, partial [Haematococcus lacustris]
QLIYLNPATKCRNEGTRMRRSSQRRVAQQRWGATARVLQLSRNVQLPKATHTATVLQVSREQPDVVRRSTFKAHLNALNTQFASWVSEQQRQHPQQLWSDGVRDYLEHAEQLLRDFKDVLDAERPSIASGKAVLASKHVSFTGLPPSEPDTAGQTNGSAAPQDRGSAAHPTPTSGPATAAATGRSAPATDASGGGGTAAVAPAPFTFGGPAKPGAPLFGAPPAAGATGGAGLFNFGAPALAANNPFGQAAPAAVVQRSVREGLNKSSHPVVQRSAQCGSTSTIVIACEPLLLWLIAAAPAPSTAPGSGPGGGEGEVEGEAEEGPQRYESEVVTNSESGDIVFKSKSKMMLFKKEEGKPPSWDTRGVGVLTLRTSKATEGGSGKPLITWTTEAGKVRYIANLPKSMQVIVNEARKMATWSAPCQLEDMSAAVTLQNVGMILPKSMLQDFNNQIKALQAKMAA